MLHRRAPILAILAVLAAACTEEVEQNGAPDEVVIASFDPATATIPLPNDLALQASPTLPAGVQKELLQSFVVKGGFPSDQEVAITVPIRTFTRDAETGEYSPSTTPPSLDLTTLNEGTVAVVKVAPGAAERVPVEVGGYANGALTIRKVPVNGSRRWAPGRYVAALRGGEHGVKTTDGRAIGAQDIIALVAQDADLSNPENQPPGGLRPAQVTQLNQLKSLYANPVDWNGAPAANPTAWQPGAPAQGQLSAFAAVDTVFPHEELASIQTFETQPAAAKPLTDSGSGQIPFPSDFLLDPATGKVRNNPAFGPAAAGLATLDGFSTTAPLLVPLSAPVDATTLTKANVRIYQLTPTPVQLRDLSDLATGGAPQIVTQPPQFTSNGAATTIALAPAVPVEQGLPGNARVYIPPLAESSRYLVIVTNGVRDAAGDAMQRSTLMDLVFTFESPLYDFGANPSDPADDTNLAAGLGLAAADAAGLQTLRNGLGPVLDALGLRDCSGGNPCAVLAYTVTTQSVSAVSSELSALPYGVEAAAGQAFFTVSEVTEFDATSAPYDVPVEQIPNVARFLSASVATLDVLDASTGALDPTLAEWGAAEFSANRVEIPALVAVPRLPEACAPTSPCPVPLVVFNHGINGGRTQMLAVADALAARGFVVAAIDAPFHGARAYCDSNDDCDGGTCTLEPANQKAPGVCTGGNGLVYDPERGTTSASGNYFISTNFFRTRDALRQDVLDNSALVLALARPPTGVPQQADNPLQAALLQSGVVVRPDQVYFSGLSLGAMIGTSIVATNPRFSRAAFTANAGTLVDVYVNSPSYRSRVEALLASLIPGFTFEKVTPGSSAFDPVMAGQYVQTLSILKWILDPADPLNYASGVESNALASEALVAALGPLAPASTATYGQTMEGDQTVPNPFSSLLYSNAGISPDVYTSDTYPPADRHELLYAQDPAGDVVRGGVAEFLETGSATSGVIPLP
jgi:hypothetical protein